MQSYPPQGGTEVSGICCGFCVTRADMESAHGAPIAQSGTQAAGRVNGVNPWGRRCDPISPQLLTGRCIHQTTESELAKPLVSMNSFGFTASKNGKPIGLPFFMPI